MKPIFHFLLLMILSFPVIAKEALIQLQQLTPQSVLQLKCLTDEKSVMLPVSERWNVKKATLNVHYISSITMLAEHSQLTIKINDFSIGQVKLNPLAPDATISLDIPVRYLRAGYNKLSFAVTQHFYLQGCENTCAPELWTDINIHDSTLHVEYESNPIPLAVSSIAKFIFDPKIYPEGRVNIITENRTEDNLTLAAIVASGVARRFDYRKVLFEFSHQIKPEMDNIVIGTTDFMQKFLQPHKLSTNNQSGSLKIFPLPLADGVDNTHALIAISGATADHIKLAALTFSNISISYPGEQELSVFEFKAPELVPYSGRDVITANKSYDFKTLNFPTTTFKGLNPISKEINFRLPVDISLMQNQTAKLLLNLSYGAGMRESTALNILVNGIIVRAIGLNNKSGDYLQDYRIDLPVYIFKPGTNTITFSSELHPELKECDYAAVSNLFISIYENSTITFPDMPHFVELPKLELLMLNGFPFTRWPDGYESMIYLTDPSSDSISAALNLIGLMTQKNGFPMLSIKIGLQIPETWQGDLIIIGDPAKLPEELKKQSPLYAENNTSLMPYPVIRAWENETSAFSLSRQTGSIGNINGMIMQFESPYQKGRTVMMLQAQSSGTAHNLSKVLLDPEVQAQVSGGLVLVEMDQIKPRVTSLEIGKKYLSGKQGKISPVDSFLYQYPYTYHALIGFLLLSLSAIIFNILKRKRATHQTNES